MTQPTLHSVSVSAIITNAAGAVLLIRRRDNGHWEPPGGVLEHRESILDGLKREVREETGLEINPQQLTGVYKNMLRNVVALVFRAQVIGPAMTPTGSHHETSAMDWVHPSEVPNRCDQAYAVRVTDALDQHSSPTIRTHDGVNLI